MTTATNGTTTPATVTDAGTRVKFECVTKIEGRDDYLRLNVEVLITSADHWESISKGKASRWDGQLLEDGRVVALRVTDKEERARKLQSHDTPWPRGVKQLRKLRGQLLDFFEEQEDVGHLQLEAGGNGECVIRILKAGDTSKYKRAMPDNFNIRLDCHDPMNDD